MKPIAKAVIAIVAVFAVIIVLMFSGYIDIPESLSILGGGNSHCMDLPPGSHQLQMSDFEIFSALNSITIQELDYTVQGPYIDALNSEVFYTDTMTAYPLLEWFEADMAAKGWTPGGTIISSGDHWVVYIESWQQGDRTEGVLIGEGTAVYQLYGHTTVFMTSCGPTTTYRQFVSSL